MLLRLLLAVNSEPLRARLQSILSEEDILVTALSGADARWEHVEDYPTDVLLVSRSRIPNPASQNLARLAESTNAPGIVVMLDEESDAREEAELLGAGADVVLSPDVADAVLERALDNFIDNRRILLTRTLTARRSMVRAELADFISSSPAMQRFMKTVYRVVDSDAPLLINGETGVGKERLARAIHGASRRSDGPFISVNCGAIPENLLESQLFGHEKGAFTGAARAQRGCFELAHRGIVFLDEITEMPFHLQVKLLQVLQDYAIRPVGGESTIDIDVRVIAASNKSIENEVRERRFRHDLYYRLSVVNLTVPPLRERREDIPDLAASFVGELAVRVGRRIHGITREALQRLTEYSWPGNVRELINVLERAVLLCEGAEVTPDDLPEEIRSTEVALTDGAGAGQPSALAADVGPWLTRPLREGREAAAEQFERAYLGALLRETQGRIAETAKRAGIEPRSLFTKMRRYGLRKESFKGPPPA
jgi:two-component system response regulator AtoC